MRVSKEISSKVGTEIHAELVKEFAKHGLVKGKNSLKYGDEFQIKVEAHSNNDIQRMTAKAITEAVTPAIHKILESHNLKANKMSTKFGDLYSITIKAEPVEIGRNGVNVASDDAYNFELYAWQYRLNKEAIGTEAIIKGKKYFLAGLRVGRNTNKLVIQDELGNQYLITETAIKEFGGKPIETLVATR